MMRYSQYIFYFILVVIAFMLGRMSFRTVKKTKSMPEGKKDNKIEEGTEEELVVMTKLARFIVKDKTEERKRVILQYTKEVGRISNNDVIAMFEVPEDTANKYLRGLEKEREIKKIGGAGKLVYYAPVETPRLISNKPKLIV